MRRLLALSLAALAAIAFMTGRAEAGKPDYSGSYSVANASGATTEANVTITREHDGEWTVRLVGQRLPDSVESLMVQTVGADGVPVLRTVCTLDPALLREGCTVRNLDPARAAASATPVWAELMARDSATGALAPLISIPLEQG